MNNILKIVFAGTPEISQIILEKILTIYKVSLVLTQPDRPSGRGKKLKASVVKELALSHGIEVFQPQTFKNNEEAIQKLKLLEPDIMIVVAYGLILPEHILNIPKLGCINIHVSLLPKFRGAAPIQRAIMNGEKTTGITIIKMDKGLDTGDILMQEEIIIDIDETSGTLHTKLANLSGDMIIEYLKNYKNITPIKQSEIGVSYAHKIDKTEAKIDWQEDSLTLSRKIHSLNPAPGCYSLLNGNIIKIWRTRVIKDFIINQDKTPGTIVSLKPNTFMVICGSNSLLEILELQAAGKTRQMALQYLVGHPNILNNKFE